MVDECKDESMGSSGGLFRLKRLFKDGDCKSHAFLVKKAQFVTDFTMKVPG